MCMQRKSNVDASLSQIGSFLKWEQAFRVYSNILTKQYPSKATELLQYNHTIHVASMSYIWENVYAYDPEFRNHISRHPSCAWNVILQQAWTMILKDRLKMIMEFSKKVLVVGVVLDTRKKPASVSIEGVVAMVQVVNSNIAAQCQNTVSLVRIYVD